MPLETPPPIQSRSATVSSVGAFSTLVVISVATTSTISFVFMVVSPSALGLFVRPAS